MQLPLTQEQKPRPRQPMLEAGSKNLHIRKTIIIRQPSSLPQVFWVLPGNSKEPGTCTQAGRLSAGQV